MANDDDRAQAPARFDVGGAVSFHPGDDDAWAAGLTEDAFLAAIDRARERSIAETPAEWHLATAMVDRSREEVVLPPGLVVPLMLTGKWAGYGGDTHDVLLEIEADYDSTAGRYRIVDVAVSGVDVTTSLLRRIPLQRRLRDLIAATARVEMGSNDPALDLDLDVWDYLHPDRPRADDESRRDRERRARSISSPHTLQQVAAVYRIAELANDAAAKTVAQIFRLEPRTASNWIRRARERGFFDVRPHG